MDTPLTKKDVENMVQDGIKNYMFSKQFTLSKIQAHEHNGVDNNRISERDLLSNMKINTFLISDTTETVTITSLPGVKQITFTGFAANNKTVAATKRCIINGIGYYGPCYRFSGTGSSVAFTSINPIQFIQASNSMYVDSASLTNNRVGASNLYLAYGVDETATEVAKIEITAFTGSSVTLAITLAADWKVQGAISFS